MKMNFCFYFGILFTALSDIFDLLFKIDQVDYSFIPRLPSKTLNDLIFIRSVPDETPIRCISCALLKLSNISAFGFKEAVAMALFFFISSTLFAFFISTVLSLKKIKSIEQSNLYYTTKCIEDVLMMQNISINFDLTKVKVKALKPSKSSSDSAEEVKTTCPVDLRILFTESDSVSEAQNETKDCRQQVSLSGSTLITATETDSLSEAQNETDACFISKEPVYQALI